MSFSTLQSTPPRQRPAVPWPIRPGRGGQRHPRPVDDVRRVRAAIHAFLIVPPSMETRMLPRNVRRGPLDQRSPWLNQASRSRPQSPEAGREHSGTAHHPRRRGRRHCRHKQRCAVDAGRARTQADASSEQEAAMAHASPHAAARARPSTGRLLWPKSTQRPGRSSPTSWRTRPARRWRRRAWRKPPPAAAAAWRPPRGPGRRARGSRPPRRPGAARSARRCPPGAGWGGTHLHEAPYGESETAQKLGADGSARLCLCLARSLGSGAASGGPELIWKPDRLGTTGITSGVDVRAFVLQCHGVCVRD